MDIFTKINSDYYNIKEIKIHNTDISKIELFNSPKILILECNIPKLNELFIKSGESSEPDEFSESDEPFSSDELDEKDEKDEEIEFSRNYACTNMDNVDQSLYDENKL